jgi:hypothetical protein
MRASLDGFRVINQRLRELGAAPGEAALLALFDRAGFGPGVVFRPGELSTAQADGLRLGARAGRRILADLRRERTARPGWHAPSAPPAEPDYLARALRVPVAPSDDLLVLECHRDAEGRALDGRRDYRIRFSPPAEQGFWSLAAYATGSERLVESEGGRYAITGTTPAAAASVEIWISSDRPEDPARRAAWLPVRNEPFFLVARLRDPAPAALDGSWTMPPVEPDDL